MSGARLLAVAVALAVSLPDTGRAQTRQELEAAAALAFERVCELSARATEAYTALDSLGIVTEPAPGTGEGVVLAVDTAALRATGEYSAGFPDSFFLGLAIGYHCVAFRRTGGPPGSEETGVSFIAWEGGRVRVLARVRRLTEVERPPFEGAE